MQKQSILPASWDVPATIRDRLGRKVGRQRAMSAEGHLLLVLHAPPAKDQDERQARLFWRKPDGTWNSDTMGGGPGSILKHLDEYAEQIDKLDRQEETASSSHDYFEVLQSLTPLHRAARNLHSVLQEARKSCPEARELIDFRDRAYDIDRSAELLATGTEHGLEFAMTKQAEQQSESSEKMAVSAHRLNLLAAFFFPLATLCAVFGMDMESGIVGVPEPYLFAGVIGAGLLAGVALTVMIRLPKQS